jgi:hypothetical protein
MIRLTEEQKARIAAAGATLRGDDRALFFADVRDMIRRGADLDAPPSDAEVDAVIEVLVGVTPFPDQTDTQERSK